MHPRIHNTLTIRPKTGAALDNQMLHTFVRTHHVNRGLFSLDSLVPVALLDYWGEYRTKVWGCPSDAMSIEASIVPGIVTIKFDTLKSAPVCWLAKARVFYHRLEFQLEANLDKPAKPAEPSPEPPANEQPTEQHIRALFPVIGRFVRDRDNLTLAEALDELETDDAVRERVAKKLNAMHLGDSMHARALAVAKKVFFKLRGSGSTPQAS